MQAPSSECWSGATPRDLTKDLDAIAAWNAKAQVRRFEPPRHRRCPQRAAFRHPAATDGAPRAFETHWPRCNANAS
jgi:hypothetical protein